MFYFTDRAVNGFDKQVDSNWSTWFSTPGDADDFIFYWDEECPQSEK